MPQLTDAPRQLHFEGVLQEPLLSPPADPVVDLPRADDEHQCLLEVLDVELEPVDVLQVLVELGRQFLQLRQLVLEHQQYFVIILFLDPPLLLFGVHLHA